MDNEFRKLIRVIKSITSTLHFSPVRNYIDLFYKKNGKKQTETIEYYFKIKKREINK